jgi:hypothetical protein
MASATLSVTNNPQEYERARREWQIRFRTATTFEQWKALFNSNNPNTLGYVAPFIYLNSSLEMYLKHTFRVQMLSRFERAVTDVYFQGTRDKTRDKLIIEASTIWFEHDFDIANAIETVKAHYYGLVDEFGLSNKKCIQWRRIIIILEHAEEFFNEHGLIEQR